MEKKGRSRGKVARYYNCRFLVSCIGLYCVCLASATHAKVKHLDTLHDAVNYFFTKDGRDGAPNLYDTKRIKITTDKIVEDARQIAVTLHINVGSVERVLLLKQKNTGYTYDAIYMKDCAGESTFIAEYRPAAGTTLIKQRIATSCIMTHVSLLLWVKTKDGKYYTTWAVVRTTRPESPG